MSYMLVGYGTVCADLLSARRVFNCFDLIFAIVIITFGFPTDSAMFITPGEVNGERTCLWISMAVGFQMVDVLHFGRLGHMLRRFVLRKVNAQWF